MGCVIDHLRADHRVTVIRDFRDARGADHRAGEDALIRKLDFDWADQQILIEWERNGSVETLVFALASKTGPGNGRMREYFELGDYVASSVPGKTWVPNFGLVSTVAPELPPLTPEVIRERAHYAEALERVWALAGRKRFAEADEQLRAIAGASPNDIAEALGAYAKLHAFEDDPAVYEWLRDRAIDHWYGWGAQATSGGEGAARLLAIKPAMTRFQELDRWRQSRP